MSIYDNELVQRAREFAFLEFEDQMYDEAQGLTMNYYLEAIASRVIQWGFADPTRVSACYLSTMMTSTGIEYEDLVNEFGHPVASIVEDLSNEGDYESAEEFIYMTSPKIRMNLSSVIVAMATTHVALGHSMKDKDIAKFHVRMYPIFKASLYDPWRLKAQWADLDQMYETVRESLK